MPSALCPAKLTGTCGSLGRDCGLRVAHVQGSRAQDQTQFCKSRVLRNSDVAAAAALR